MSEQKLPQVKGYRILIDPDPIQEKFEGTTLDLVKVGSTIDKEKRNMQSGLVLQVGADCYKNNTCKDPWCKKGDTILFKRGGGVNWYDSEDKLYIILNEEDVLATL